MKYNYIYIIGVVLAALAFTACSDDDDPRYLDGLRVSQSYLAFPADGGSCTITVNASGDWEFTDVPDWLTISPAAGAAGQYEVTFTATAATDTREKTIKLRSGDKTQEINLIQQTEKQELQLSTCADVNKNGVDGKAYRVKGTVTKVLNTQYGNFYLNDGTDDLYIYGTVDASGKYNWASFNIEVGDEVMVEGPRATYNGTVELKDALFLSVEKSLIKVDSLDAENTLPLEGGNFTVYLTNKGNGITINIPEDAKSWLSVTGIETSGSLSRIKFHAAANAGGARTTTLTFTTSDGKKNYTSETTITQDGAIVAMTCADFNAQADGDAQYKVTGIVTELYTSDKQGKSFYIQDYTGKMLVYRAEGFLDVAKVGDIVTVTGKHGSYKDNPQMTSGICEVEKSIEAVSIKDFMTKDDDTKTFFLISGKVCEPTEDEKANNMKWDITTYGNFVLEDAEGTRLYIYGVYIGWGTTDKKQFGTLGVQEGDIITMIAYKTSYKGLIEGVGYYMSHETPAEE